MPDKISRPLYQQVKEDIKEAINSGKYPPKFKIPPEPALSEEYSVSRITIRRAIEELCSEGYLIKMQGRGTFVNALRIHRKFTSGSMVESFTNTCTRHNLTAGAKVLDCRIVPSRRDEQKFFGLPDNSLLIYVQRIRTADDQPVFLENTFLPYEKFRAILDIDLNDTSIFDVIQNISGHRPSGTGYRTLEITRASDEQSEWLKVPSGEPLFFLNVYFIDELNNPVCIGRQYYIGSCYMFEL